MRQPLLYLPGLDGTGRLLHRQPELWERYKVCCASYPQDRPASYAALAAAAGRLEAAGGRPAVVLAESFGGAVALTLALSWPDLVERLVLVNTFAYFPRRPLIALLAGLSWLLPPRPSNPATLAARGLVFFCDFSLNATGS
jgi:pimeloyl-ACP methyl ester carboxylesterase